MEPLVESLHVSRAGPLLRTVASYATTPLWRRRGSAPPAPPHHKRAIIVDYAKRTGVSTFVETGTFRGDTTAAVRSLVERCFSIELDPRHAELARRRFQHCQNVEIIEGDSVEVLPDLVRQLADPALFWLDGHFSGGRTAHGAVTTPIESEMRTILSDGSPDHIVLVDDARLFDGSDGYPTMEQFERLALNLRPDWVFEVANDVIRFHAPVVERRSVPTE